MAEKPKSLLEGGAVDALGEGAARFERVIDSVKRQHAVVPEKSHAPAGNPLLSASPGEEWARQYQTQVIGPDARRITPAELSPVARAMILPASDNLAPPRVAEIAPKVAVGRPDIRFGQAEKPKKSWLGRMFSRT